MVKTDEQLVSEFLCEPNDKCFDELYKRHFDNLASFVDCKYLHDANSAEEIAQLTFVHFFENINNYDPKYNVTPWLWSIAGNLALNQRKVNRIAA